MLRLEALSVRFGGLAALDAVCMSVGAGEIVGLVGPNGAGKTTLFDAISGFIRPSGGAIEFCGVDMRHLPMHRRVRLGIGRTFQIPQPMGELTVRENLRIARRFGAGRSDSQGIDEILDLVGLAGCADRDAAGGLSLNQHKALEVARALAAAPKLLLLDEILAGLETPAKNEFVAMLDRVRRHFLLALLVIEHDIETIGALCNRIVALDSGRVIADGSPESVFTHPEVVAGYIGAGVGNG